MKSRKRVGMDGMEYGILARGQALGPGRSFSAVMRYGGDNDF